MEQLPVEPQGQIVKFQAALKPTNSDEERDAAEKKDVRLVEKLHERNASKMFHVVLDLGGMYIKLGQVLSATATVLPIPEQYRQCFRTLQSNVLSLNPPP